MNDRLSINFLAVIATLASEDWEYPPLSNLPIAEKSGWSELDAIRRQVDNVDMRRALRIVLVVAALLGLFGQTVAIAASPPATAIEATDSATMPMDCLDMMQGSRDDPMPCNRMTLACITSMGCSALFTLDVGQPVVEELIVGAAPPAWFVTVRLEGRSVAPELHPPSALA